MSSCSEKKKDSNDTLENLTKVVLKSIVLVFAVFTIIIAKNHLISQSSTLFNTILYAVIVSVVFSIIGFTDNYIFTNLAVGLGIGLAMEIVKINK